MILVAWTPSLTKMMNLPQELWKVRRQWKMVTSDKLHQRYYILSPTDSFTFFCEIFDHALTFHALECESSPHSNPDLRVCQDEKKFVCPAASRSRFKIHFQRLPSGKSTYPLPNVLSKMFSLFSRQTNVSSPEVAKQNILAIWTHCFDWVYTRYADLWRSWTR